MLASWSEPYGKQQDPSTSQLIELSIVESVVMHSAAYQNKLFEMHIPSPRLSYTLGN